MRLPRRRLPRPRLAVLRKHLVQPLLIDLSVRLLRRSFLGLGIGVDRLVRQRIAVFVDQRLEADLIFVGIFGAFVT